MLATDYHCIAAQACSLLRVYSPGTGVFLWEPLFPLGTAFFFGNRFSFFGNRFFSSGTGVLAAAAAAPLAMCGTVAVRDGLVGRGGLVGRAQKTGWLWLWH